MPIAGALSLVLGEPIWTLNVVVFLSFLGSGLGCYALARRFIEDRRLAALAGFAFSYCPYKLAHLTGHYNLILTATIPPFALGVVTYCEHREGSRAPFTRAWPWALCALVSLLVTAFADYYYTYFLLWFGLAYMGYWRFERHVLGTLPTVRRWSLPALAISTLGTLVCTQLLHVDTNGAFGYSADLFGYVLPSASQRLLGGTVLAGVRRALRIDGIEHETFVGIGLLVLVCVYLASRSYRAAPKILRALLFSGVLFLVLSMPAVRVAGAQLFCFPNAVLHLIPLVNHLRVPARFNIMVMLVVPIVAMIAVEQRVFPKMGRVGRTLVVAVLLIELVFEFSRVRYFTASVAQIPEVYRMIADRAAGTLMEIPFGIRDGRRSVGNERTAAMWFQTVHRKRLIGGMLARLPDGTFDRFQQVPLLANILDLEETPSHQPRLIESAEDIETFLRRFDVRYILIAPEFRGSPVERYVNGTFAPVVRATEEVDGFALMTLRR